MWLFLTPNNNNYEGHCDSTSQVQSLGGGGGGGAAWMWNWSHTHADTELNGVSGDNMLVAGLIPRHLRKAERGSGHR